MIDNVIFQWACVKLPYFYFRSEIWQSERSRRSTCSIVPNFMAIGQTVADIWRFFGFSIFQDGGRRHLGFLNFRNFNGGNGHEGQTASSCQISWRSVKPSWRYGDFSIFPRWRLSAILDLWCARLDHPRRHLVVFITVQNLIKIYAVLSIICKFYFCE